MRKFFIAFVLILTSFLGAQPFSFREQFQLATPGDYIVTSQGKSCTFLMIQSCDGSNVVLEEVSIPAARFPRNMTWKQWYESGARGNTSWMRSKLSLTNGQFESGYSFTHHNWLDLSKGNSFMSTLINLSFREVAEPQRKRTGKHPGLGRTDRRSIWHPRLVVDGMAQPRQPFFAWRAQWPKDGSDLSKKWLEIYTPVAQQEGVKYPTYLPYWIEVEGGLGKARVRVIDSGTQATSPQPNIPL